MAPWQNLGATGGTSQTRRANLLNFAHVTREMHRGRAPAKEFINILFDVSPNGKFWQVVTITVVTAARGNACHFVPIDQLIRRPVNEEHAKAKTRKEEWRKT